MRGMLSKLTLVALASLIVLPAVAQAQSAIHGTVRDASGGVLPSVTVEAAQSARDEAF